MLLCGALYSSVASFALTSAGVEAPALPRSHVWPEPDPVQSACSAFAPLSASIKEGTAVTCQSACSHGCRMLNPHSLKSEVPGSSLSGSLFGLS